MSKRITAIGLAATLVAPCGCVGYPWTGYPYRQPPGLPQPRASRRPGIFRGSRNATQTAGIALAATGGVVAVWGGLMRSGGFDPAPEDEVEAYLVAGGVLALLGAVVWVAGTVQPPVESRGIRAVAAPGRCALVYEF